jgi:hypothetical protein
MDDHTDGNDRTIVFLGTDFPKKDKVGARKKFRIGLEGRRETYSTVRGVV